MLNLIEICVASLQLAIFTKISRKAAHAFFAKVTQQEMLENLGATDIQLIPHLALRLFIKYHANRPVVEAGVASLVNNLLPVWCFEQNRKSGSPTLTLK